MTLDHHDKIAIGITAVVLVALYLWLNNSGAGAGSPFNVTLGGLPQASNYVPSYLTYNMPQIAGNNLPLPTLTNSGGCSVCSLFPSPQPALGFNTL